MYALRRVLPSDEASTYLAVRLPLGISQLSRSEYLDLEDCQTGNPPGFPLIPSVLHPRRYEDNRYRKLREHFESVFSDHPFEVLFSARGQPPAVP